MFKFSGAPRGVAGSPFHYRGVPGYRISGVDLLLHRSYAKLYCPYTGKILNPSILSGFKPGGAVLDDSQLCWGSVDGFRLVVMKKEWLYDKYKEYFDKGDAEWFVTCCVINGMEKNYAVALRTALLRALKLPLNGDRPIEEVQKAWQASWNADAVHQEAENILAGRSPKGVEIRYTGQTQPNWWLPLALQSENPQGLHSGSLKEKYANAEADRQAAEHRENEKRQKEKEEQAKRDAVQKALVLEQQRQKEEADRRAREQQEAAKRRAAAPKPTDMTSEQKALYEQAVEAIKDSETATTKRQKISLLEGAIEDLEKATKLNRKASMVFVLLEEVEAKLAQLKVSPPASTGSGSGNNVPPQPGAGAITLTTFGGKTLILQEEIGHGGYGIVYKGLCGGAVVAVKRFVLPVLEGAKLQEFLTEATTMMTLNSPHLLGCLDLVAVPNNYGLVMPYMPKGSLWDVLRSHPLTIGQQFQIAQDVSQGLEVLHGKGIIHRDLKSLNVLIDAQDRAKVADFGLAKIKTDASSSASRANMVGTLLWLAPEIVQKKSGHTRQTDVYSFGLILWEIASRLQPFQDQDAVSVFGAKMHNEHERPPAGCPERLSFLMQWCWKAPTDRPTAPELVSELAKGPDAPLPLTGGLNLFNRPPVGAKAKSPAASPQKPASSINNTGGW